MKWSPIPQPKQVRISLIVSDLIASASSLQVVFKTLPLNGKTAWFGALVSLAPPAAESPSQKKISASVKSEASANFSGKSLKLFIDFPPRAIFSCASLFLCAASSAFCSISILSRICLSCFLSNSNCPTAFEQ